MIGNKAGHPGRSGEEEADPTAGRPEGARFPQEEEPFLAALIRAQGELHASVRRRIGFQDASDVVQEAFLRALVTEHRPAVEDLGRWLWAFARRILHEHGRASAVRRSLVSLDILLSTEEMTGREPDSAGVPRDQGIERDLFNVLTPLTALERWLVEERYRQGRSMKSLAEELQRTEKATRSLLERAMRKLRAHRRRISDASPRSSP